MTSKFTRILLAMAFVISVAALAQTGTAATPGAAPASPPAVTGTGTKVGTISMEQAIFATNEGRRDFEALSKKLEPKQNELKNQNDEIDALKKQLSAQQDKLNDDARANLVKQIETKQKSLDRQLQDAREDAQNQQNEIAQRIIQKLGPVLIKYAADNGFGMIMDTSQPWPQSPVVWWGEAVDVTKPVVDLYNAQSGVPAPATTGAAPKPTGAKAPGTATKPATTTKPADPPK
jgi:outer membrane protein